MKIHEIVSENLFTKGLDALKSIGSKSASVATKADDLAVRTAQTAKANSLGAKIGASTVNSFKAGDKVTVNLRGYRNDTAGFNTAKGTIFKNDTETAIVKSITPSPSNSNVLIATLETLPGKVRQEPVYYKGQIIKWQDVADPTTTFSVPVEYLKKTS